MKLQNIKDFYDIMLEFGFNVNNHSQFMFDNTYFGEIKSHIFCKDRPLVYFNFKFVKFYASWYGNWKVSTDGESLYWFSGEQLTKNEIKALTNPRWPNVSTDDELREIVKKVLENYKNAKIQVEKEEINDEHREMKVLENYKNANISVDPLELFEEKVTAPLKNYIAAEFENSFFKMNKSDDIG